MAQELTVDEANTLADDVLGGPDFLGASDPGVIERARDQVQEWIVDFLDTVFGRLFSSGGGGAGRTLAFILLGVFVLIMIAAVVRAVRMGRIGKDDDVDTGARIVFDEVVDPAQLREQLSASRAAGNWRSAVVAGFRLAVVRLIEEKIVAERAGATTGDFGRTIAVARPDLAGVYEPAALGFERAFYSDADISAADLESVEALLLTVDSVRQS
jgi:hypothetical protein